MYKPFNPSSRAARYQARGAVEEQAEFPAPDLGDTSSQGTGEGSSEGRRGGRRRGQDGTTQEAHRRGKSSQYTESFQGPFTQSVSIKVAMMLAILVSLKTIESPENGLQPYSGTFLLFSLRTETLASLQSHRHIDADAWCKQALMVCLHCSTRIPMLITVEGYNRCQWDGTEMRVKCVQNQSVSL